MFQRVCCWRRVLPSCPMLRSRCDEQKRQVKKTPTGGYAPIYTIHLRAPPKEDKRIEARTFPYMFYSSALNSDSAIMEAMARTTKSLCVKRILRHELGDPARVLELEAGIRDRSGTVRKPAHSPVIRITRARAIGQALLA